MNRMLMVTRTELTALTALQPHQLTRRETLGWLTPIRIGGRTGYTWAEVEPLVLAALPRTGRRIARYMVEPGPAHARRIIAETVREMRETGRGYGRGEGR